MVLFDLVGMKRRKVDAEFDEFLNRWQDNNSRLLIITLFCFLINLHFITVIAGA